MLVLLTPSNVNTRLAVPSCSFVTQRNPSTSSVASASRRHKALDWRQAEELARTHLAAVAADATQAMGSTHLFAQSLGALHGPPTFCSCS